MLRSAAQESQAPDWKFYQTEPLGTKGEAGERFVWEAVKKSFTTGKGVAFLAYGIFDHESQNKREPDILIAGKELGLTVIEVKSCTIDQIEVVEASRWVMVPSFYSCELLPFKQAQKQLDALLGRIDRIHKLATQVPARIIVALPRITWAEWRGRGFDETHHTCPPIIFKDDLDNPDLATYIRDTATIIRHGVHPLEDEQWKLLLNVLMPIHPTKTEDAPIPPVPQSHRQQVIYQLQDWIADIDWQQVEIGRQIPPGPQRIRGMAGSGKSILLCQKAARMHLHDPTQDIALVFFTRSLYGLIIDLVDQWVRHFSGGTRRYNPLSSRLKVLHAWGGRNQPGLYSTICKASGVNPHTVNDFPQRSPNAALALACTYLLKAANIPQMFDAILIDEGQDLIVDEELKFEDKQPFYWMAYQALKPVDPNHPERRRLIWAYDEVQSLNSLLVPTSKQVLGESLSQSIGGSGGGLYDGGIRKAHVIRRCYRSPNCIITAAHAIAMGLLRPDGMLSGLTNQADWRRIGYEVEGDFRRQGSIITLRRPPENSPNPVQQRWDGELLELNVFKSRQAELSHLVERIKVNLIDEGLNPSQDILIITLGSTQFQTQTAKFLLDNGIDFYIPTAPDNNTFLNGTSPFPNKFWNSGGVTVSRVHRAKGNEANIVYVVGIDFVARDESNIQLRNQLFVALTRARGWVSLSGIGHYPMYKEISQVIESKDTFKFTFQRPKRDISESA